MSNPLLLTHFTHDTLHVHFRHKQISWLYFPWSLISILLCRCTMVPLFSNLLSCTWVVSRFWQLRVELAMNIEVQMVFCGMFLGPQCTEAQFLVF